MKSVFRGCVLLCSLWMLASCGRGDVLVLTLAHSLDTGHTVHRGMLRMAERLEELSGGGMRVDVSAEPCR